MKLDRIVSNGIC